MTREEVKKAANIMLAFADGVEIQYSHKGQNNWLNWINESSPSFDWQTFDYRIKKEPKYRPFETLKECWNEMLKHEPFGWLFNKQNNSYEFIGKDISSKLLFNNIFREYTFTDGTPFGIKKD